MKSPDPITTGPLSSEAKYANVRRPLAEAWTLPPEAYTDPAIYEVEIARLFRREWLCAGRVDQVSEPGDYLTLDLLGDKLVIVRDRDGTVRVLSRICRHRAAELIHGSGNARSFSCPYHAWTYRLDGSLVGAPLMEGVHNFDRDSCKLPEIRSEVWEGWIFVNFDPEAEPLAEQLEPLRKRLAPYRLADMVATETAVYPSAFNWKVLVDNFMEAYHHIAIHRETFEPAFPASRSHVPDNDDDPFAVLVMPQLEEAEHAASTHDEGLLACVVFPFHLFAPGDGMLAWYQLLPEEVGRFTLRIYSCFPRELVGDPEQKEHIEAIQAFTRDIHQEDIGACEAVWAGLCAPMTGQGRLSPLEKAIWQFNRWWTRRMGAGIGGAP